MIKQSDIERLHRFAKGLSNREEDQYIYAFFSENEENREFKQYILQKFDEYVKSDLDEVYDLSYLLDRIHHIIHKNGSRQKPTMVKRIYQWYSIAAAVLLIPILIAGGIWITEQSRKETIVSEIPMTSVLFAPMGSRISFSLPDGTEGWLNSGSSLKYTVPFASTRQVTLMGEAWFDVAHDSNHPFEIAAGQSKVKVLGTKFNLNAYPEDKYVEVALQEGSVEFFVSGISPEIEMKPNERLVFSEGAIKLEVTDVAQYSAWIEGKLVFKSEPMSEVCRRIERWYNVDVVLVDKGLEEYAITGTFVDDSLEDVLLYLSMTSPIRYQIIEQRVLKDMTVQKEKVLLYQRNH
ncbi:FecR family protein [Mariniphaga sediminis]|uniref:FecR family protein n=1 Tax=Mariniphaga sediminis TaxID=1628158 RepID=UPI0035681EBC